MSAVITVENLSKKYIIGHQRQERYTALRDVLANGAKRAVGRILHPNKREPDPEHEEFWALREVSFEIKQGDRVGIIGRNGAGKSTLLKILSRITEPSSGRIRIKGRVASLLEVGTGFHPELTGRENIYLNGAILGMSRAEIKKKFDEIVSFAEVEKFLDTPVKRYSSGMYVRLAFAVAAHLEPEILIVDEVLAVGDAQFQKKCMGKMAEVGKEGRTVLFVSHNMNAVEQLCTSAISLEKGVLRQHGHNVREVIKDYLQSGSEDAQATEWLNSGKQYDNPWFKPLRLTLTDADGRPLNMPVRNDSDIWVQVEGEIRTVDPSLQLGYGIFNEDGILVYWTCHTDTEEQHWYKPKPGLNRIRSKLAKRLLNEGSYRIELLCALYYKEWIFQPGLNSPSISLDIKGGLSDSPYWMNKRAGALAPIIEWKAVEGEG